MASYQCHPLPQMTRTPQMTRLRTNFEMQTDPEEVAFLTTYSQKFQAWPFQVPPTPIRPTQAVKNNQHVEKLPESTNRSTFTPHHSPSIVKATAKHLDGFPTIKGDERHRSFVSHYNDTFQGAWSRAAQPVDQHSSSVIIGDPVTTVERETTHSASFSRPTACRPRVVKEHLKINLGNFSKNPWSSTSKETYCPHKLGGPVVLTRRNKTSSSLPSGDTDTSRNRERMSLTTNRVSFSDPTPPQPPVYVHGSDLMTKSNVQFSPALTSGLYYTTTAKHHYGRKQVELARPAIQFRSNILTGPEPGPNLSTTQADFLPLRACKQTPCLLLQQSHIRFPLAEPHFSTTHSEDYTFKPLIVQQPGCSHFLSHIVMK
ncbi:uncharacterized protein LOC117760616 isoform X1 [Hippoglossus hippoglossus]|uniref:uncharacterized protein LOC117760616 isoform X1 n=1 Tax=Hippoglossus hippoglossus TaxID=8267 RepID=UPI00148CA89D|nr:uncharacterized protein LOC117760616 isoform X1 [Hippoglossus hippoglossus]